MSLKSYLQKAIKKLDRGAKGLIKKYLNQETKLQFRQNQRIGKRTAQEKRRGRRTKAEMIAARKAAGLFQEGDDDTKTPRRTGKVGRPRKRGGRRSRDRKLLEFMPAGPLSDEELEARKLRLKTLILLGKERGYLTHGEINDHLPDVQIDSDQMESIVITFNDGILLFVTYT